MPPTCRGVTYPDNALFCPRIISSVVAVQVLPDEYFDTHKVVTFDLKLGADDAFVQCFRMPETFLKLPMHDNALHEAYHAVTQQQGPPTDLTAWGQQVEQAADLAYRWFQMKEKDCSFQNTISMPKRYRGRCQPAPLVKLPIKSHFKQGRPGDYQPDVEVHTYNTQAKVKQIRRLQALLYLLRKGDWQQAQHVQAWDLWHAIQKCKAFQSNFLRWAQNIPEIGPLPVRLPNPAVLDLILQFAKHDTNHSLWIDKQRWKDKVEYRRSLDYKCQGNSRAFARIRDPTQPGVYDIQNQLVDTAITVPQPDDTTLVYCHSAAQFKPDAILHVHDIPATMVAQDSHCLTVRLHGELPELEQCEIVQNTVITHPNAVMEALQQYWDQYWTLPREKLQPPAAFHQMIHYPPNLLGDQQLDYQDSQEWYQAVRTLNPKTKKCRGKSPDSCLAGALAMPRIASSFSWNGPMLRGLVSQGDPMSVTAMLAIAYAWIQHIQRHTNALAPSAFADNWGWSTTIASQHAPALRATKEMAEFLNMIIDWRKSWLWSTHKEHISTLKAAVKKEAPEEHVPEMLSAMDLGAQLTYRGNSRLGKLRDRLQKANRRLQRLEGQVEPLHSKARLITAGIYPVALYGMELDPQLVLMQRVILSARLPGLQDIHRAEIFAIVVVMERRLFEFHLDAQKRMAQLQQEQKKEVEAYGVKFSEFANTFAIFYLQFTGLLSTDIWPCYDRKLVKSLFVQGAQIFTSGFAQRPSFPYQAWVHDVLRPFLRDHQGTAITAIPDVDWIMSEGQYKVLKEDLKGEWKNRAMAA
ncbi:unnamed protein product, partial [Cladocopium goreaui]